MRRQILGSLAILMLAGCGGPDDPLKQDLAALQGDWTLVLMNGAPVPRQLAHLANMTVQGGKWMRPGVGNEASFTLDPSKTPRQIDLIERENQMKLVGIYRIEGDTLTVCGAEGNGAERPTEFAAGPNRILLEFRREKK